MSTPTLVRVEPATIEVGELPRTVTLVGTNLYRSVALSLDDDARAHLELPIVLLNDEPLKIQAQSSPTELSVMLPPVIAKGTYDVTVKLHANSLHLRSGLRVLGKSSQPIDASSAYDGGEESSDTTSSPASDVEQTTRDQSSTHTSTDATTKSDATVIQTTPTDASTNAVDAASSQTDDAASDASTSESSDANGGPDGQLFDAGHAVVNSSQPLTTSSEHTNSPDSSSLWVDAMVMDATPGDAAVDAGDPDFRCAPGEFGSPEVVSVQGYADNRLWSPTIAADGFTMYFTDGSNSTGKLMKATRDDRGSTFVDAELIPTFFPSGATGTPYLAPNGLALYFYSIQASGMGSRDLYVATRNSVDADFTMPTSLTALNSSNLDHLPWVSRDELWVAWVSQRDGQTSYWTATRPSKSEAFSTPQKLTSLSLPGNDGRIFITYDGLRAYFASRDRSGGLGSEDIWFATRESVADEFDNITNLGIVNTTSAETDVTLTHDGEELFFIRTGSANTLYRAVATCN